MNAQLPIHTTLVQTEGPHEITVRPLEPEPGFWYAALEVLQRDIAPVLTAA